MEFVVARYSSIRNRLIDVPIDRFWTTGVLCFAMFTATVSVLEQASAQTPRTVLEGVYTKPQATRGLIRFVQTCALCHGIDLQGAEHMGPPIGGDAFAKRWRGKAVGDVYDYIHEFMPANDPGSLDDQAIVDVIAFILESSSYPDGTDDLPADPSALRSIRVEPTR